MVKNLLGIALLALSLPFWLPTSLGGETSYHFVLTDSMKGSLDPGTFVVLRRSESYRVGDVVAFREDLGNGKSVTILHRIVGRTAEGRYIIKGDAATTRDEVEPQAVVGRMVLAIPWLGFVSRVLRGSPLLVGVLVAALFLLDRKEEKGRDRPPPKGSLFLPAVFLTILSTPFAAAGLVAFLGTVPALLLLFGLLGITRLAEALVVDSRLSLLWETSYMVAIIFAISSVSLPAMVESIRSVMTL